MASPAPILTPLCPRCGAPVPENSNGLCLTCAGSWALSTDRLSPVPGAGGITALPAQLGDYELLEELGRGGMGVVYAARQRGLNRLVALKVLAGGALATVEAQSRFEREAQTIARLRHPNIVAVHAAGRLDGLPFYAMDLIDGLDLGRICANQPLDPPEAARIVAAVARAIQHAHEAGVVHRDLKPSNILLDAADVPRVVDFGVARWIQEPADLTQTGQILGSPAYMAPEQATGEATPAVDVHALGAILFYVLTGQPPFAGKSAVEVLARVVTGPPPAPGALRPSLPPALDAVTLRCLAKDPKARYSSAGDVADDLERWLNGASLKTHYAPLAEARQIVADIARHQWLEGFQRHAIHGAIDQLARAVQLAPDYAEAHAALARLHVIVISTGWDMAPARRDVARQALARAEELEPGSTAVTMARAAALHGLDNKTDEAMDLLRALLRERPDDGPAALALGRLAMASGRWREAGEWFRRAALAHPPSGLPRQLAAYHACLLRDYPAAATWIDDAVRVDSKPIVRRLMQIFYHWLADPDPKHALHAIHSLPEEDRRTRFITGTECYFLLAQRRFAEAYERFAATTDDEDRVASPQATVEIADLLRLQRLAEAPGQNETEAKLREALDPGRVKSGRSAHEAMCLAFASAMLGDADGAMRYSAEACTLCPWPQNVIDGARLRGASEFLFAPGQLALYSMLGFTDRFFEELPRWINVPAAVDVRSLAYDPIFDPVRRDPRFREILATAQMPIRIESD